MRKTIILSIVSIVLYLITMYLRRKTNEEIKSEANEPELVVVKNNEDIINEDEINEKEMEC
jgi:Ca2+/H+ antiporter